LHDIIEYMRQFMLAHGYKSVALGLLLENAGVPVPGETILILASAASYNQHELRLPLIILVGTIAATVGDNIGYWVGRKGGRPLLERWRGFFHVGRRHIESGEALIEKHGPAAIFIARFIAGARIFAGPLAGVLHMDWPRFALFNFLGAVTWVTVIATLGHLFGTQLERLLGAVKDANYILLAIVAFVVLWLWIRRRRAFSR
jgi:membrane protein DedA with SNARE-associated domain